MTIGPAASIVFVFGIFGTLWKSSVISSWDILGLGSSRNNPMGRSHCILSPGGGYRGRTGLSEVFSMEIARSPPTSTNIYIYIYITCRDDPSKTSLTCPSAIPPEKSSHRSLPPTRLPEQAFLKGHRVHQQPCRHPPP